MDDVIKESWARCVQTYFTLYRFSNYTSGYDWEERYQNTPIIRTSQMHPYTPMFLDMCDDFDQSFKYGPTRFVDQWDGNFYMLPSIEAALKTASTFQDLERLLNSTGTDQSAADYYNQYK
ncbi:hypothetical protein [Hymenobacter cellulosilyticus]|uniref:Uncharacterized protein n=1 Tax=Hymenobacter cellulosilyticus TaxID=2932248 RepID=A0A8T9QAW2_9BACT|nr:hypothetical protein [Hymenobacter cellulosilyticus]UOQ72659.1 hypothetical protein MUN79_01280 [Hymenobacter cellulosilyticus]